MIAKNKAPVIQRCLDSVLPVIAHWVIVDTGSTDGTPDFIRRALHEFIDCEQALHRARLLCPIKGRHTQGLMVAKSGRAKPYPAGALCDQPWIYKTGFLDKRAVAALMTAQR